MKFSLACSPVHIAASVGSVEGIELLLVRGGGDASLKSIHNTTPLHDAAAQGHTGDQTKDASCVCFIIVSL